MSKKIQLPGFGDRVLLAAGEDAHTGSHKLHALLDRIAKDEAPTLTRQETGSLRAVPFKRRRGQSEKRTYYANLTASAVELYHELRAQDASRSEDATIDIVRGEMAHLRPFSRETIKNALHRWRGWDAKRRQSNKLK